MTADEIANHTLSLLRRLDTKVDRVQASLDDYTGLLQDVERRLTRIENKIGESIGDARSDSDPMWVQQLS